MLTTTPGQAYDLTFFFVFDPNGPITVTFGGSPVAFTSTPTGSYDMATATGLVATGTSTALDFSAVGGDSLLDDVSITTSVPAAAPEPSTWTMMLTGIGRLGFLAYRQTRKAKPPAA